MKCKYDYCIYNRKSTCILDEIQVDSLGMCAPREIVAIPEKILRNTKKSGLEEIAQIWGNYDKQKEPLIVKCTPKAGPKNQRVMLLFYHASLWRKQFMIAYKNVFC